MKKLRKFTLKSVAIVLSFLMVMYLLPMSVYADLFEGLKKENQHTHEQSPEMINEIFEVEELREESVKHFRLEGWYLYSCSI